MAPDEFFKVETVVSLMLSKQDLQRTAKYHRKVGWGEKNYF